MSNEYNKLYEGILSRLAKGAGETIKKGADKVAKGAVKGAKGIEKTIAKLPVVGSITKANKAVAKVEDYFSDIAKDINQSKNDLAKLKGKVDGLYNKLADAFEDNDDEDVLNLLNTLDRKREAIQSIFKDLSQVETGAKNRADDKLPLKRQEVQTESFEPCEKLDSLCEEIDTIMEELG